MRKPCGQKEQNSTSMKLRILGNSIRLRLTKKEVASLTTSWTLQEKTPFGEKNFFYALQVVQDGDQLSADFNDGRITLFIPVSLVNNLAQTDLVGVETTLFLPRGESLNLLVEKDFKCLDEPSTDQSDMYDNPNKICD